MDLFFKIAAYLALGLVLVIANTWYVGLIFRSFSDDKIVVAPIRVVGGPKDAAPMDEALARMLLVRLRAIMGDLQAAQSSLENAEPLKVSTPPTGVTGAMLGPSKMVRLEAQLFEPAKIDVKVAGVEVGGVLSWVQQWFAQEHTLVFTVSMQGQDAIIAGNLDALDAKGGRPFWVRLEKPNSETIVDTIAFAVIQRAWAREEQQIGELKPDEFRALGQSLAEVSEINRRVRAFKAPARGEYAAVLERISPLADRITSWGQFTYFVATVAESAEDNPRALVLYQRLKDSGKPPISAELLEGKLKALRGVGSLSSLETYRKIAEAAVKQLNGLFGLQLEAPPIELAEAHYLNAFWDGKKIHLPPGLEDIPDLVIHEATYAFLQARWTSKGSGQNGALAVSYADVLTSVVKQAESNQIAAEADWTIAPGAIAWLTGKTKAQRAADHRPLRSLKAPGTAYDDPKMGKDPQVARFSDRVSSGGESEVFINSGISNKAFYETAVAIGTQEAAHIWVDALKQFSDSTDFPSAAQATKKSAIHLHGENSAEYVAVQKAWRSVGIVDAN